MKNWAMFLISSVIFIPITFFWHLISEVVFELVKEASGASLI
jgi:hypothetical protein